MLRRIESEERPSMLGTVATPPSEQVVPIVADAELETPLLPADHPQWVKDALTLSHRARELIAKVNRRPYAFSRFGIIGFVPSRSAEAGSTLMRAGVIG